MQAHTLSNTASPSLPLSPPEADPVPETIAAGPRGLAHDAGNLLGGLALYADLLRAPGVLRPEHRHYADELRLLANRGTLLLARWQEACGGTPVPRSAATFAFGPADAAASLRSLRPLLERIAGPTTAITLDCPSALPAFPLPVESLERVVLNLVRNAAAALTAQGRGYRRRGHIRIALASTPAAASLTVEDDGPGLDLGLAARFLQPSAFAPCAGLGLRIVHELTAGSLRELVVRPGLGTTFVFTWPRAAQPICREDAPAC